MIVNRAALINTFPVGRKLREDDFEIVEIPFPEVREGEVLIRNRWLSVEAGQRTHLSNLPQSIGDEAIDAAVPAPVPGKVWPGQAVGEIIESRNPTFPVGAHVVGWMGWREYAGSDGTGLALIPADGPPPNSYIGTMGLWGGVAYFGLLEIARIVAGETIVISAAAGAVGIVAVQIAKLMGCRVVGIVGSDEKAEFLTRELGADAAINYRTTDDLRAALLKACPSGIDVYFDMVGGATLEALIDTIKLHGRIVACGAVAGYDGTTPVAPRNYFFITPKRLSIQGFTIVDYIPRMPEYQSKMAEWIKAGKIVDRYTAYCGIDSSPKAFVDLFNGANIGKMLIKVK